MIHTKVSIDNDFLSGLDCVINPSVRWNGWACPSFAKPEVEKIMEEMNQSVQGESKMVWSGDDVLFITPDGTDTWQPSIESDGVERWAIGAWSWTWSIDE